MKTKSLRHTEEDIAIVKGAKSALIAAKALEKEKLKSGYRWIPSFRGRKLVKQNPDTPELLEKTPIEETLNVKP